VEVPASNVKLSRRRSETSVLGTIIEVETKQV
jgi:hypothetical protein